MRRRHVVILFQHRLFGEAIARALSESGELRVSTIPVDTISVETLRGLAPDAIVLEEQPCPGDIKASLLDFAPALTVVVGPEGNTAEVYQRHEVIEATAAQIVARIMTGSQPGTGRHAEAARSRSPARPEEGT